MITSSADMPGYLQACISTGMPRPSSRTVKEPSAASVTSISLAW